MVDNATQYPIKLTLSSIVIIQGEPKLQFILQPFDRRTLSPSFEQYPVSYQALLQLMYTNCSLDQYALALSIIRKTHPVEVTGAISEEDWKAIIKGNFYSPELAVEWVRKFVEVSKNRGSENDTANKV